LSRCSAAPTEQIGKALTGNDRGWALVSVLWALVILSILAAATEALTVTTYRAETRVSDRSRLSAAIDAGIARAILGLKDGRNSKRWRVDGTVYHFSLDGTDMAIAVQDEIGRIDLNAADGSLIRQLLEVMGLSLDAANTLTDRIVDWRSSSGLTSLHGATDADYQAAGYFYHPRHGEFQSVDELKLVMGMTPGLFKRLQPNLTVYSRHPTVDTNIAPETVLKAYYFNQDQQIQAILDRRQAGPIASDLATPIGTLQPAISTAGRNFSIDLVAQRNGVRMTRHAVIMLTDDDKRPYLLLAWQ